MFCRYGVKYTLWNPIVHKFFPSAFRNFIKTMLLIDNRLKMFPKDVFYYIMNMCHWSWAGSVIEDDAKSEEESEESEDVEKYWLRGNRFRPRRTINSGEEDEGTDDEDEDGACIFCSGLPRLKMM